MNVAKALVPELRQIIRSAGFRGFTIVDLPSGGFFSDSAVSKRVSVSFGPGLGRFVIDIRGDGLAVAYVCPDMDRYYSEDFRSSFFFEWAMFDGFLKWFEEFLISNVYPQCGFTGVKYFATISDQQLPPNRR